MLSRRRPAWGLVGRLVDEETASAPLAGNRKCPPPVTSAHLSCHPLPRVLRAGLASWGPAPRESTGRLAPGSGSQAALGCACHVRPRHTLLGQMTRWTISSDAFHGAWCGSESRPPEELCVRQLQNSRGGLGPSREIRLLRVGFQAAWPGSGPRPCRGGRNARPACGAGAHVGPPDPVFVDPSLPAPHPPPPPRAPHPSSTPLPEGRLWGSSAGHVRGPFLPLPARALASHRAQISAPFMGCWDGSNNPEWIRVAQGRAAHVRAINHGGSFICGC